LAGILVGIETYSDFTTNNVLQNLDNFVIYSFLSEIVLKIISEGLGPHLYFIGSQWQWNLFDFLVVLLSVIPIEASQIKVLRLIRFARITKVFSNIPEIQMILQGLYDASIYNFYMFVLLLITFYVFGLLGLFIFRENDPWNFGSIEVALLTMMRIVTLDVIFINLLHFND
jgi:voltage-gated sodium channel